MNVTFETESYHVLSQNNMKRKKDNEMLAFLVAQVGLCKRKKRRNERSKERRRESLISYLIFSLMVNSVSVVCVVNGFSCLPCSYILCFFLFIFYN